MLKGCTTSLAVLIALMVLIGCSSEQAPSEEPESPGKTSVSGLSPQSMTTTPMPIYIGEPLWPLHRGDSVQSLVEGQDAVVIGTIRRIAHNMDPRTGYLGVPTPAEQDKDYNPYKPDGTPTLDELSRPPGREFTVFEVVVEDSFGPEELRKGDVIFVAQAGGIWEGRVMQLEGYPLFQVGVSYFLTLDRSEIVSGLTGSDASYFTGIPFAQYMLDDAGKLQSLDEMWKELPAVQEMSGKSVEEVAQLIGSSR